MALEKDIERLTRVPLFATMDQDALRLLAFAAESRIVAAGEVLFRRGETAEGALLVLSGSVELDTSGAIRHVGPGGLIGEQALLAPLQQTATATARDTAAVLRIPRSLFMRVLHEYPANARRVRDHWAQRLGRRIVAIKDAIAP